MHRRVPDKAWLLAFASLAALATPLHAQTDQAATERDQDDIIVTANRREQTLVEVPSAVTAIGGDALQARALNQIEDLAAQVPGFSVQKEGRTGIRLILRGQNVGGSGASVATMIDEVVLNSATTNGNGSTVTSNLETYDLERIEVLRGPQGTLYGATAQGGLLKYVTRRPDLSGFSAGAEVGTETIFGHETGYAIRGFVNVPVSGKAALRVTGGYNDVPGYIDNPLLGRRNINGGERWGGRASLLIEPDATFSIRLTASTQREDYGSEGYAEVNGAPLTPNGETAQSYLRPTGEFIARPRIGGGVTGRTDFYNLLLEKSLGGVELTSSTSFAKVRRRLNFDISDQPIAPGLSLANGLGALFGQPIVARLRQLNEHEKFIQELRIASPAGGAITWQGGVFYTHEDVTVDQRFTALSAANTNTEAFVLPFIPGLGGLGLGSSSSPSKFDELSAFGDVTFRLGERFEVSVGGRYTNIWQEQQVSTRAGLFNGPVDITYPRRKLSEDKFTYSIAPRFIVTPEVSIYGRVASGYRPGGFVAPIIGAPADFPNTFTADNTVNYEIGTKGELLGGKLFFDVALYQIDWTDVQILTSFFSAATNQTYTVTGNGGDARSRGVEWNFGVRPVKALTLGWNGAYTDAELREDAPGLGGQRGDRLPYVPRFSSTLTADLVQPLNDRLELSLGASWARVGSRRGGFTTVAAISNSPRIPGYDAIDLRAGLRAGDYRLQLVLRNVTNERGLIDYRSTGGFNAQVGQGAFIQPRTLLVTLGAQF